MDPFKIPFDQLEKALKAIKPQLVHAMGVEALAFIDDNFASESFHGATTDKWPGRKKKEKVATRRLLVKTGQLRRSFVQTDETNATIISTDDVKAKIHNEGGDIKMPGRETTLSFDRTPTNARWRFGKTQTETQQRRIKQIRRATISGYTIHMPKRQFIGNSPVLTNRVKKVIIKKLKAQIKLQ